MMLRAEGERAAKYLAAQGEARAIQKVNAAIKSSGVTPELLAYQYLEQLPKIANNDAATMWMIPSQFGDSLQQFARAFADKDDDGVFRYKADSPNERDREMAQADDTDRWFDTSTDPELAKALAEAQSLGYAEADPTADVEGHDAAAKAAILATIAFGAPYTLDQVAVAGITAITAEDNAAAAEAGYVIKLLAIAERGRAADGAEGAVLRVHPTLLPREHPLASVRGAFNAVFVEAENAGELMFYGPGAGGAPTASAVMGDVVSIAQRIVRGGPARLRTPVTALPALDPAEAHTSFMVVLRAADQPGVLRRVAGVFEEHGVSIETLRQVPSEREDAPGASLRLITHRARQRDLDATVEALAALDVVHEVASVLRVEGN